MITRLIELGNVVSMCMCYSMCVCGKSVSVGRAELQDVLLEI